VLAALAVAAGAFGAHALEARLTSESLATWETAARYHMYGAIALVVIGMLGEKHRLVWAGRLMLAGVLIFGGTVYALALGGPRWLGAVTPLGGLSIIVAWVLVAIGVSRDQRLTQ
jgi:uncharacterized membrane protein YgdD (TMEM256/DUF423 family)